MSEKTVTNPPARNGLDLGNILSSALIGGLLAFGGSYYLFTEQEKRIVQWQAETPPVAVIDIGAIVASYPKGLSEDETNALMLRTNETITRLKDAGYLIFDAQHVIGAPKEIYVPTDAFTGDQP